MDVITLNYTQETYPMRIINDHLDKQGVALFFGPLYKIETHFALFKFSLISNYKQKKMNLGFFKLDFK